MPTFDGKQLSGPTSGSEHSQQSLNGKRKLDRLHRLLKGNAFDKIKGLGLQGENYKTAKEKAILKGIMIYKDPVKQKEMYWSRLHNLPIMVKDNLNNLEKYVDELRATTLSLKRNGNAGEVLQCLCPGGKAKITQQLDHGVGENGNVQRRKLARMANGTVLERLNRVNETLGGMKRNAARYSINYKNGVTWFYRGGKFGKAQQKSERKCQRAGSVPPG